MCFRHHALKLHDYQVCRDFMLTFCLSGVERVSDTMRLRVVKYSMDNGGLHFFVPTTVC